ncbi:MULTISPECIES: hypothetical protein [unclassified Streptomyces]|uniref:Uncharacterized protein n=1 Tax=Streptomyces sp. NBC_00060 TaxID=2975636 RepID=A0AAU2H9P8_9ACTN
MAPLERRRFILEIVLAALALATLVFVSFQTVATMSQAKEAANQVSAARLDGLYQQSLNQDEVLLSAENAKLNLYINGDVPFEDVKDPAERQRMKSSFKWNLTYWDYAYATLPGLVRCFPDDGHLILRGSREDTEECDDWAAWSQSIYNAFRDERLCQTLNSKEGELGRNFVAAIRKSGACLK